MIKEEIHQDKILILNEHVPKNRASKFIKQKMVKLKQEIETYTTIIKNVIVFLFIIDTSRQQISKAIECLNNTINQFGLTDIYRILHQTTAEYIQNIH